MSNRPNYILELKDRAIELKPCGDGLWATSCGCTYSEKHLESIGATPVPQEEPKVTYAFHLYDVKAEVACRHVGPMHFKSHKDAENYRLRCESIGPEWTDWEPKHGQMCHCITRNGGLGTEKWYDQPEYHLDKAHGFYHPTEERAQEWLDRFGKAWGLK